MPAEKGTPAFLQRVLEQARRVTAAPVLLRLDSGNGYTYFLRRVMRVVERTIDKQGQQLLVPALELEGWWTSLAFEATVIIALSADHKIRTRSRGLPRAGCLPVLVEYSYLRFKTRVVDPLGASLLRHSPLESQLPVHLYTNKLSSHLRRGFRLQPCEAP